MSSSDSTPAILPHLLSCITPPSKLSSPALFLSFATRCTSSAEVVCFLKCLELIDWGEGGHVPVPYVKVLSKIMENTLAPRSPISASILPLLFTLSVVPLSKPSCKQSRLDRQIKRLDRVLSSDAPTVAMEPAPKVKDAFSKCTEALAKRWLDTPSPSNAAASSQTSFDFDAVQSKLVAAISSEEFKEKVSKSTKSDQKGWRGAENGVRDMHSLRMMKQKREREEDERLENEALLREKDKKRKVETKERKEREERDKKKREAAMFGSDDDSSDGGDSDGGPSLPPSKKRKVGWKEQVVDQVKTYDMDAHGINDDGKSPGRASPLITDSPSPAVRTTSSQLDL